MTEGRTMKRIIAALLLCTASGCFDWSSLAVRNKEKKADDAAPPEAAQPAQPVAPGGQAAVAAAVPNNGPPDMDARIVDKKKALQERPQLFETKNSITASDPIFAPAQGLRAVGSKAEMLAFQNTINIHKATNDKYPTYDEFMDYYKQAHVELKGLRPWQVYAYDEETGTVTLMEDPQEKERISKEWEEQNRL
jgi:hypothetical protein